MKSKIKAKKVLAITCALAMSTSIVASAASTYVVKSGDVLWKIAQANGTTWQELAEINELINPNLIYVGQELIVSGDLPSVPTVPTEPESGMYNDGTYTATAQGFGGELKLTVTIVADKITDVTIVSNSETPAIAGNALESLPNNIVNANSTAVDNISGATVTSGAIKTAVDAALATAVKEVVEIVAKDGVYEATAKGREGDITVAVTMANNEIESIELVDFHETYGLGDVAAEIVISDMLEYNTVSVDSVAGATVTSAALMAAVTDAVTQSGADMVEFKTMAPAAIYSNEDMTSEVLVVGGGIAGLTAATQAAELGADVILIEKMGTTGGSTVRSGGKILAADSSIQAANGIEDTAENFYDFLMEVADGKSDPAKTEIAANMSGDNIDWLVNYGAMFSDQMEPLHDKYSPTRGIYTVGGGGMTDGFGGGMTVPLEESAVELGVEIYTNTRATELITDESGAVIGAKVEYKDGTTANYYAQAVILATGGYDSNQELMDKYAPSLPVPMSLTSANGNTGDGLLMAQAVGADIYAGGGAIYLWLDFFGGVGEAAGLYVNEKGERFMDESDFWFSRTNEMIEDGSKSIYYILDDSAASDRVRAISGEKIDMAAGKYILTADSIDALGENLGMADLQGTVDRYNALVESGVDSDYNKSSELMTEISTGPFYAIPFGTALSGTMGGPLTNEKAQVIDEDGAPIAGLYAAGEVANGDLYYIEYPGSGTSIMFAVAMGRVAGQEAAALVE